MNETGGVGHVKAVAGGLIAAGVWVLAGCGVVTTAPTTQAATTSTTESATTTSTSRPAERPSTTAERPDASSTVPADSTSPSVTLESTIPSAPPPPDGYPPSVIGEVEADSSVTVHPVNQCGVDGSLRDPIEGEVIAPYPAAAQECLLGPAYASGAQFSDASVEVNEYGGWKILVGLTEDGTAVWNQLAEMCYEAESPCPSKQIALVFDNVIISAPRVNVPTFSDSLEITGLMTEEEAQEIAAALNEGG